jgi:hypothetical protein
VVFDVDYFEVFYDWEIFFTLFNKFCNPASQGEAENIDLPLFLLELNALVFVLGFGVKVVVMDRFLEIENHCAAGVRQKYTARFWV